MKYSFFWSFLSTLGFWFPGSALVKCGYTQRKIGEADRDFMSKTVSHYIHPLRSFLEGDMKTIAVGTHAVHFRILGTYPPTPPWDLTLTPTQPQLKP